MKPVYLVIVLVILFSTILFAGCAEHRAVGIRKVEHSPIRIAIIEENFVKFFPIEVQHFPTNDGQYLKIFLKQKVKQKVEYHKKLHEETIYQKDGGALEREADSVKKHFDQNIIAGLLELLLSPLKILVDLHPATYKPYKDTKYEKIPGSENFETQYKYETANLPASYVTIALEKYGTTKTDKNGIATFRVKPEMFDQGLKLHNIDNNEVYIVMRGKIIREYKADWHPEAKLANDLYSIGAIAYKVRKVVVLGGGPYAIAGAIIVEIVSGLVVGYIIDIAATEKSEYYQWSIVLLADNN